LSIRQLSVVTEESENALSNRTNYETQADLISLSRLLLVIIPCGAREPDQARLREEQE
jgi:hypothetical protein